MGTWLYAQTTSVVGVSWTLEVNEAITGVSVTEGIVIRTGYLNQVGMTPAPAVSPASQGRIYFDSVVNKFEVSENGGAYVPLIPVGGGVGGAGAAGQATFWTGAAVVSGDNNFWWDNVTKRLGIGTNLPAFSIDLVGNMRGVYTEAAAAADGTRYFQYTINSSSDPAATAEVTSLYGAYNWSAGTNGAFIVNGLEGVVRSRANDEAGTFRGGLFRTYIDTDTDPNASMRTAIGAEISARAARLGGVDATAEPGTAFVGARIWMAPYFTAGSLGNINNFWGLWIYGEHATRRNADSAIKISTAGGGFTDDIILQSGSRIYDSAAGIHFRGNIAEINGATYTWPVANAVGDLHNDGAGNLTWTGGSVSGSGVAGQVAFWNAATNITGDANFLWDNVTKIFGIEGKIVGVYTETTPAVDGTRYFQYTVNSSQDPAATAEVTSLYGSYNWTAGTNGVFTVNGVEGAVRSRANDEAGTFRGGYFRTYIDTDTNPNASMRTAVGLEVSARASRLGGPEVTAEPGTAFIGQRIWMAPYFTDVSIPNINNSHALWILNETPNGGAWGKYIDRAITVDATTYGSGFNYNFYSDTGKFYLNLDGTKAGSGLVNGERSTASGDDWMYVRASDYRTLTSNQVYNGAFFRYDVKATIPGAPQCEVRGLEAVGSTYVADGNLLSLFGAVLRTFIQPGVTASAKTSIGAEISARASFNGGAECEALPGTAFVGARIYMAPYFTAATLDNINNFWGLWIFGEHATRRNGDAAIKIGSAGGGFTNDINFQNGSTLTDLLGGLKLVNNIGGTNPALYINEQTLGNEVLRLESVSTGDDPNYQAFQNRVATTDATVTAIHTIALNDNSVYLIHAYVAARRTGGTGGTVGDSAGYTIIGTFKRSAAGVATQIGSTIKTSQEDQAGWDADFGVSGNNVLINMTGAVNNNITWHTTVFLSNLSS